MGKKLIDNNQNGVKFRTERQASLLDCYRIALDFGLPAAERAFALMDDGELRLPKTAPTPESALAD